MCGVWEVGAGDGDAGTPKRGRNGGDEVSLRRSRRRRVASNEEICVWRIDLSHAAARLQRLRLRQELAGARSVLKILECR